MINPETFTADHIRDIQDRSRRDPALIERTIYAFGLLEAIARSGLHFVFKGGSALILLMDRARRFSTDIDIVVSPGVDIDKHLVEASDLWPFIRMTEHIRSTVADIEKRHFKFAFTSTLTGRELSILLDVLFEENPYSTVIEKPIENELLITEHPTCSVMIPSVNCIIADKLTAFAPHTSGIPYNIDKEMEIIKQLYDVTVLIDYVDNFTEVKSNYKSIVKTELKYRNIDATPDDALRDAISTSACIASRGRLYPEDYLLLKRGISNIVNHIYSENFNGEVAIQRACMAMYLSAAILTDQDSLPVFIGDSFYRSAEISSSELKKLGNIKKTDMLAYMYLIEAAKMLS